MAQAPQVHAPNPRRRPILRPDTTVVAVIALVFVPPSAHAWVPYECPRDFFAAQREFGQAIRTATPGKLSFPYYVPYPFPQTAEQVVADYRYKFELTVALYRGDLTYFPAKQVVAQMFKAQNFTYTVHRVEDWDAYSWGRCAVDRFHRLIFIIRFFDKQTGKEVQAQVDEQGLEYGSEIEQPSPLPDIAGALQVARIEYGIEGAHDAQFVEVHTENTYPAEGCQPFWPCVAVKGANGAVYILLRPGSGLFGTVIKAPDRDWYEIGPNPELLTTEEASSHSFTLPAISVGYLRWAIARRVPKKTPPG